MKIIFFSTNSNDFDGTLTTAVLPSIKSQWEMLREKFPQHDFLIVTQRPGMFLVDKDTLSLAPSEAEKLSVPVYFIDEEDDEEKIAELIAGFAPDVAVAASFYVTPFDWLPVKDAMVADFLRIKGIRTVCHSVQAGIDCFDKWRTHQALEKIGMNVAKSVYIHHALYINAGNRREIKSNIYKKSVLHEIQRLKFPIVIKDTVGLSSYGMDVLHSFTEVKDWLRSKKFTSDRIVEEFIEGEQFGLELLRLKDEGKLKINPPFAFSVNKYGITSPKQSVKAGPVTNESSYRLNELNRMMDEMASAFDFDGFVQVDLVLDGKKWFVIEINPRLSGMTTTYAATKNKSVPDILCEAVPGLENKDEAAEEKLGLTLNIKFALMDEENLKRAKEFPCVKFVSQTENSAAKQLREKGYCEIVLEAETAEELKDALKALQKEFGTENEAQFCETAVSLIEQIEAENSGESLG